MKKVGKFLFLMLVITMFVFAFSTKVKAVDNPDDYVEAETTDDSKTETNTATNTAANTATDNVTNTATNQTAAQEKNNVKSDENKTATTNEATKPHPQAGMFQGVACASIGIVVIATVLVAYAKVKKYNY